MFEPQNKGQQSWNRVREIQEERVLGSRAESHRAWGAVGFEFKCAGTGSPLETLRNAGWCEYWIGNSRSYYFKQEV